MNELNIDFWRLLELLIGGLVFYVGIGKVLLAQVGKRIDEQFASLKRDVDALKRIERDFLEHKAELPTHYVRREDYVRGQSVIEAKLDTLGERISAATMGWNGLERRRYTTTREEER